VLKLLLLTFLFFSSLYANKVVYLSYDEVPKRVVKGEIFPITLKYLSTVKSYQDILYTFSNHDGLEILTPRPEHTQRGKYFYDTFYLLSTKNKAKLPDVKAILIASQEYPATKIYGENINIITLNPQENFSNLIANSFEIIDYKTISFDNKSNIIVFVASAINCDIKEIKFKNISRQGIESIIESYTESRVTYFLVIDKKINNFSFSYFNLLKNNFSLVSIPIIVEDDSVATQSDLKPRDQSHERIKIWIAITVTGVLTILILLRKKYIYLVFIMIPLVYILLLLLPEKKIVIKAGTNIYLLPVNNSTIFETTRHKRTLLKEGSIDKYVKVKLKNEKIGWVRNEDIITY
jgi:hypothetical protein